MTLDDKIKELFESVAPTTGSWNEADEHCIVYNYTILGADYGDDEPGAFVASIQLHLLAPIGVNLTAERKMIIRKLMRDLGTTTPMITDASDLKYQHFVFECQKLLSVEEVVDGEV